MSKKTSPLFYILNNSAKNKPIANCNSFGSRNADRISHESVINSPTSSE